MEFILGFAAYLLYFIYDYNSVTHKNRVLKKFFLLGTLLLVAGIWVELKRFEYKVGVVSVLCTLAAVAFLFLLIYTLFFAIPFNDTYVRDNDLREAYTAGVYSLCRHPGVLWFAGLSLCLWGICRDLRSGIFFLLMTLCDVLYVVFQDLYTFPKTFINYGEYKETTPFLIPGGKVHKK